MIINDYKDSTKSSKILFKIKINIFILCIITLYSLMKAPLECVKQKTSKKMLDRYTIDLTFFIGYF